MTVPRPLAVLGPPLLAGLPRAVILLVLAGCSSSPAVKPDEARNLHKIQTAYDAVARQLGRPPANLGELRPQLEPLGDPEQILRSPRDGLPYVILWGVDPSQARTMPPPIVAYEKVGANGKHYALTVMGVVPMSDQELANALTTGQQKE